MDEVKFAYKPNPLVMGLAALFFGVIAPVLWFGPAQEGRGLIIDKVITLDPGQAAVFYKGLAVLGGLMAAAGIAAMIMGLMQPRYLVFGSEGVAIPGYLGKPGRTIAYADITALNEQAINRQRFLYVHYSGGKIAIMASMLPNKAAFDQVCDLLATRASAARA